MKSCYINSLEYLIQIFQMSHDFLPSEICFISNKRIVEVLWSTAACRYFAVGRKRDAMSPNYL